MAFKAEDRSVDVWFAGQHACVIDEIACREVIGAVGDDVEVLEQFQGIVTGEPRIKGADIQERVHCLELLSGRLQLRAANVSSGVDDLALQVGVVHDVEINDAERAHTGCAEIKCQG